MSRLSDGGGDDDRVNVSIPSDPAGLFSEGGEVIKLHIERLSNDTHDRD